MQEIRALLAEQDCQYPDPGTGKAIIVPKSGHVNIVTGASGETNTLPNPTAADIYLTLNCVSHGGGDRVVTAAGAINQAGNTIMTFGAARDLVQLVSIRTTISPPAYLWQVVTPNTTVALS